MKEQQTDIENASEWHVCSLILQCNPKKIAQIQTALLAVPYTEIPAVDAEKGKLVVVMQSHDEHQLLREMEDTRNIDGVIDVTLVYHEQDVPPRDASTKEVSVKAV